MAARRLFHGTGPGVITPDGCSVELYQTLVPNGEPQRIHAAAGEGASILELGSGTGRITHALLALGHEVVAVDESPEMLAHIRGAETVCSPIQALDLDREFDVVLMMSYLVELADDDRRRALLAACRRHVADDGCVILQRQPPGWYDNLERGYERSGEGFRFRMKGFHRLGPDVVEATMEYVVGEREWTQTFVSRRMDDDFLESCLAEVGLTVSGLLDDDPGWIRAVPR
ncbi:class I SAM-dependent methyltransferase [Rhizohabitans arisaemae]|uniref:class I SAM-dependent methyltransferase n=1 Tax=Rhizohabitans arisaemae TaxID=2720610 RepID=UPI0024B1F31F|nr:class I SAM-dependent methyltransferase [Rhizohabitans arisaemae]